LQVGAALLAARADKVPWKVLQRVYGRDRRHLWRCLKAALAANETSSRANETSSVLRGPS
jgi:hypothetical protein